MPQVSIFINNNKIIKSIFLQAGKYTKYYHPWAGWTDKWWGGKCSTSWTGNNHKPAQSPWRWWGYEFVALLEIT